MCFEIYNSLLTTIHSLKVFLEDYSLQRIVQNKFAQVTKMRLCPGTATGIMMPVSQ